MSKKGQRLYKRAKKLIPGGTHLFSKRPEMFLPENWPSYFKKAKNLEIWDLDDNQFTDMCFYVGTNSLGYGNREVDQAVLDVVDSGNMTTLNCPEEVALTEKLINLHPWADMARFSRSGGEANAIAIRIARAASGNDKVAICGYHGWHDWYLSANLNSKDSLSSHLMEGLDTSGVPSNLRNSVFPFQYNDFRSLEEIVSKHNIGTIKMEVSRNLGPENNFLEKVRDYANQKDIILIFDECTSGFRETFGGLHKKYSVEPDMSMFGKALGNGYAITSVIGKENIMKHAEDSFISSTFWTERIGFAAGIATLDAMEKYRSWEKITQNGKKIINKWNEISKKSDLKIQVQGLKGIPSFSFENKNLEYKTLITQEMLKRGFLATNLMFVTILHTPENMEDYFKNLEEVFKKIKECEDGRPIEEFLDGPVSHSGFQRLN